MRERFTRLFLSDGRCVGSLDSTGRRFIPLIAGGAEDPDDKKGKKDPAEDPDDKKTYTREEMQEIVDRRISRELRKFSDYDDLKTKAEKLDEIEAQNLSELEQERQARQKAEDEAQKRVDAANQRAIVSAAALEAAELGIAPKKIKFAIKCADLDDVDVADDGEVDTDAVKAALEAVVKEMPELKSESSGGGKPSADGGARNQDDKGNKVASGERLAKVKASTGIGARSSE